MILLGSDKQKHPPWWPLGIDNFLGPFHTMVEGREVGDFHESHCKKSRDGFSTLHIRGQSSNAVALQNAYMAILFNQPRRRTLKGSLGWTGMETQTMVERSSVFFSLNFLKIDKILAIILQELFWVANKVGCSFLL